MRTFFFFAFHFWKRRKFVLGLPKWEIFYREKAFHAGEKIRKKWLCPFRKICLLRPCQGNESDVGNIDFELQAYRGDKFLGFTLFLNFKELFISPQPCRCPIEMGFRSKCCISNEQVIYTENSKLNIADMWLIPLDHVTYCQSYKGNLFKD